ncbi:hypothetical protein [Streptomyces sp. NPDC049915]|uniref:SCO2400 family protein n=1 Tax=Streptomyces sp. NPDC049915 TaxID=3155510 RepID=UPI00343A6201
MDFCHSCHRHLNGALACPGCGVPVDQLRAHAEEPAGQEYAYGTYDHDEQGAEDPPDRDAPDDTPDARLDAPAGRRLRGAGPRWW